MDSVQKHNNVINIQSSQTFISHLLNFCWSSPAQSFFVPSPAGIVAIFYCLTTLGIVYPFRSGCLPACLPATLLLALASVVVLGSKSS
jgi:hypothetical protein